MHPRRWRSSAPPPVHWLRNALRHPRRHPCIGGLIGHLRPDGRHAIGRRGGYRHWTPLIAIGALLWNTHRPSHGSGPHPGRRHHSGRLDRPPIAPPRGCHRPRARAKPRPYRSLRAHSPTRVGTKGAKESEGKQCDLEFCGRFHYRLDCCSYCCPWGGGVIFLKPAGTWKSSSACLPTWILRNSRT